MVEKKPVILEVLTGVPGVDAVGRLRELGLTESVEGHLEDALYPEQGVIIAHAAGVPIALQLPANTILGRLSSGNLTALSVANIKSLLRMVSTSTGAPDAGKPVLLDGGGKLDSSLLPPIAQEGEANDGTNLGATGGRVFAQKNGLALEFRRILAAAGQALAVAETSTGLEFSLVFEDGTTGTAKLWSSSKIAAELATRLTSLAGDSSPALAADLNIGAFRLMSGAQEVLRWEDGTSTLWILGKKAILPELTDEQPGDILQLDSEGVWRNVPLASSGGLTAVQNDPSPVLGGMLDHNGQGIGDGTRKVLDFADDPAGANHVRARNAPTGSAAVLEAAGADTDIPLNLRGKGTGGVQLEGLPVVLADLPSLASKFLPVWNPVTQRMVGLVPASSGLFPISDLAQDTGFRLAPLPSTRIDMPVRVENPDGSISQLVGWASSALTLNRLGAALRGGTNLTWNLRWGAVPYGTSTPAFTSGRVTAGDDEDDLTAFDNVSIPSGNYIWLTSSAVTGSPTELLVVPSFLRS